MTTKQVQKPKKMLSVLRKIRSQLTGKVKKIGDYTYSIDDKITVELNYYCNRTTSPPTCEPHTISVRVNPSYTFKHEKINFPKSPTSGVFTTRTIQKRADGSYNWGSLLTAITKGFTAVEKWEDKVIKIAINNRKQNKAQKTAVVDLKKAIPKRGRSDSSYGCKYGKDLRITVSTGNDLKPNFHFKYDGTDLTIIKKLTKMALEDQ